MALLVAALCESETPGAEITTLFSLIQDPLHRYWVYSSSAFALHRGKLHGQLEEWC